MALFKGRQSLSVKLAAISKRTREEVGKAVRRGCQVIADDAADSILTVHGTGRIYNRGRGKTHQASAPGEAPQGESSGGLGQTMTYVMKKEGPDIYSGVAAANTPYATRLEFGGAHVAQSNRGPVKVYIAPRPFMQPAFDKNKEEVERKIHAAIVRAARAGAKR